MKVLITGGCGFIGSHAVDAFLADGWQVTNFDKLTYAGDLNNVAQAAGNPDYRFVQGDLCEAALIREVVAGSDLVLNFAAETHVDRSLQDPAVFARTDVEGVVCLLEAIRRDARAALVHMSTDEVFGSLTAPEVADEGRPFAPSSPYSASKAAAELMIRAYVETYDLPVTVLRSCNVYGPRQHREKFIPLFIERAKSNQPLPLYGDGRQEREWLFVEDLVAAIRLVSATLPAAGLGEFNIGSGERIANITVARQICGLLERSDDLITPVLDRPGHDRRYAVDSSRIRSRGWQPAVSFAEGLARTIRWYAEAPRGGSQASENFSKYFEDQYGDRLHWPK